MAPVGGEVRNPRSVPLMDTGGMFGDDGGVQVGIDAMARGENPSVAYEMWKASGLPYSVWKASLSGIGNRTEVQDNQLKNALDSRARSGDTSSFSNIINKLQAMRPHQYQQAPRPEASKVTSGAQAVRGATGSSNQRNYAQGQVSPTPFTPGRFQGNEAKFEQNLFGANRNNPNAYLQQIEHRRTMAGRQAAFKQSGRPRSVFK